MTELSDIRKKITIKTPLGAKVEYWNTVLWESRSKIQAVLSSSMEMVNGKPTYNKANIDWQNKLDEQVLERIVSWDYTEDGKELPLTIESLRKLPATEVEFLSNLPDDGVVDDPNGQTP